MMNQNHGRRMTKTKEFADKLHSIIGKDVESISIAICIQLARRGEIVMPQIIMSSIMTGIATLMQDEKLILKQPITKE